MIRPRGNPPIPKVMSKPNDPVETTSTGTRLDSPRRMTAPSPYCFLIWLIAILRAFSRALTASLIGGYLYKGKKCVKMDSNAYYRIN